MLPDKEELQERESNDVPEAQLVFDGDVAELWLADFGSRKQKVFASVRFEPDEMPKSQMDFLLSMAANAIADEMFTRKGVSLGFGVLFVPVSLAKSPVLSFLVRGKKVGKYIEFRRQ